MNETIRAAVLGLGHIGKRHAHMISQHPEMELVAISDILEAKQLGWKDSSTPWFSSLNDLLNSGLNLDIVHVCTPNGLHAEQAIKCLEAGLHVVIEKPMALKCSDCESILYKALQYNRKVFCVMQNRYSPPSRWLKQMVEQGALGDILQVQINCYWNRDDRYYRPDGTPHPWRGTNHLDGGVLFTQFSHFVDTLYWVFGDIRNIQARMKNFTHQGITDFDDSGIVMFELLSGGNGVLNFTTSVWDTNLESSITVIGSKGSLKIGGQYMNEVVYCHIENYVFEPLPPTNPPNDYGPFKGSAANHAYVMDNIAGVLKQQNAISTNAMEGLKVVDLIERFYNAAKNNPQY